MMDKTEKIGKNLNENGGNESELAPRSLHIAIPPRTVHNRPKYP